MPVTQIHEFLQLLERSTLLTPEQFADASQWGETQPKALAQRLVKQEWLTTWQASQLLAGKGSRSHFFLGKYRLLELLGMGGMGAVYKAVQPGTGRTVALKKMHRHVLKQPRAIERFLREIRSAAAVDDPHVVRAFDADSENDNYYLVMEYVPGKNLKTWIKEQQSLPINWACECIRQAALGLQHAHELGMLHRDIKPSNLLVTQGEEGLPLVKLLDLGLARFASESSTEGELTRSGQVIGTPDYMSPEQARNSKLTDIRADIFSLGCTLFELLTGQFPFGGETVMEKLLARSTEDAQPVRKYRPDVPAGLDAVLARMLARDPNARYATPAEVAIALAPYSIGVQGAESAPRAAADVAPRPPRREAAARPESPSEFTLKALQSEIAHLEAQQNQPAAVSPTPARPYPAWLKWGAALVATVLLTVVVTELIRQRKTNSASSKSVAESPDVVPEKGKASPGTRDPIRREALWILKLGGTLEIEPDEDPESGATSGDSDRGGRRLQVSSASDLPNGKFEITAVAIHEELELTADHFRRLARLHTIETLDLSETQFDEADLSLLAPIDSLRNLKLADTRVSDAGVALLKRLAPLHMVDLSRSQITGGCIEALRGQPSITELVLSGTHLKDKDLAQFKSLPQLVSLNLSGTDILGPGLAGLRTLKNLRVLDLGGIPMRDRALRHISGMESLETLRLTRAKVMDDDLKLLSGLSKLQEFGLASTQITGEGLKHLSWLSRLERFDLQETFIGDNGLEAFKDLTTIKTLRLRRTQITDAGVQKLAVLKNLEFVDLGDSKATRAGCEALKKALPNCQIDF
jgi:serine/threonine protein kinase